MKAKHTAGSWKALCDIQHNPSRVSWGIETAEGEEVADIMATGNPEETRLNAHLIAASPELLEALSNLIKQRNRRAGTVEGALHLWDDARAAIAKATGGAP